MPIWQFEAVNWGKYFTQFRLLTKSVISNRLEFQAADQFAGSKLERLPVGPQGGTHGRVP
ncbi:Uncharacterised protein [Serratia quinivorans]|jgi:hypothetical protein|nr:Uncharacterised protein [Serratia quinivorans]CAI1718496.1 Uncharacterised protein [Serratia quinivorans]